MSTQILTKKIYFANVYFKRDGMRCVSKIGDDCKYLSDIVEDMKKDKENRLYHDIELHLHLSERGDDDTTLNIKQNQYLNASKYIDTLRNHPDCEVLELTPVSFDASRLN